MAELVKKLHFKKDAVEQTAKAYTTTAEAGTEYIENKLDGISCYVATGDTTDIRATVGRIKKSSTAAERAMLSTGKPPYNKIEWRMPGTYTFTVPAGVTTAKITLAGGGGGGGGYATNVYSANGSGGKGGNGNLLVDNVPVLPSTYKIIVGAGGDAGKNNVSGSSYEYYGGAGASGGASTFGSYTSNGGGGGGGGRCANSAAGWDGSKGSNAGNGQGGQGGRGGYVTTWSDDAGEHIYSRFNAGAGGAGWVIIEYGGDI